MNVFHRTSRDSRLAAFLALVIATCLALVFMLMGLAPFLLALERPREWSDYFVVPFGVVGVAVFIIAIRGAWTLASGSAVIHVLSVDDEAIEWGFIGKEERALLKDVARLYFNDGGDSLTCALHFRDGKKTRLPYIESVLGSHKSQKAFIEFMTTHHPEIPISPPRASPTG
jgi:hypothetical protein